MKTLKLSLLTALFGLAAGLIGYLCGGFQTSAAKNSVVQWEYCAITGSYLANNSENQAVIEGAVNICYLQANGCLNEEIKTDLIYSKFIQDFRLVNTNSSIALAWNRARDTAYSKAVAKLGNEGWEIIAAPSYAFDEYVPNIQGSYSIYPNAKEIKPDIYFKRLKQN